MKIWNLRLSLSAFGGHWLRTTRQIRIHHHHNRHRYLVYVLSRIPSF